MIVVRFEDEYLWRDDQEHQVLELEVHQQEEIRNRRWRPGRQSNLRKEKQTFKQISLYGGCTECPISITLDLFKVQIRREFPNFHLAFENLEKNYLLRPKIPQSKIDGETPCRTRGRI